MSQALWARGFQADASSDDPHPGDGFGAVELRSTERAHDVLELQLARGGPCERGR